VLVNLIDNAVRHSHRGDEIGVGAEVRGGDVVLSIRDRGPGMSAEAARGALAVDGRSLGFYICKGIVERHGGSIWIASEPARHDRGVHAADRAVGVSLSHGASARR